MGLRTGGGRAVGQRDTLHRLVDQGIKFVVATGRHHVDVRSIRDALGLDIYLITSNGAVVHDKQDTLVFNQALPSTVAAELIALERDPSIHINVYYGDEWLVEEEMPWLLQFVLRLYREERLADADRSRT